MGLLDDVQQILALLEQASADPPPPEFLAALQQGQERLAEAQTRLPATMAKIAAELNGAPPAKPVKPLHIKG